MSPPWNGRDEDELTRANDVDPTIGAVLEAKDLLSSDNHMLEDPVEIAPDEFIAALGPHASCNPKLPIDRSTGDSLLERSEIPACECDFREMQFRHGLSMPIKSRIRNGLASKTSQCRKPKEAEETSHIGDRRHEHRRRYRGVDPEAVERDWNENPAKSGGEIVDDHRRSDHRA
jgi:hypothetical protein